MFDLIMKICDSGVRSRGARLRTHSLQQSRRAGWCFSRQVRGAHYPLLVGLAIFLGMFGSNAAAMQAMSDEQMSNVTGQAIMMMDKQFQSGGTSASGVTYGDTTFYKAGLDAKIDLNMNIKKLQLGCGGINGAGCDIDIDNFSISGQDFSSGRPASDATLTRPFFEFAVKNDNSRTLREVTGIRLSAEKMVGLLSAGQNTASANGINTLSGYMTTTPITGTATTAAANLGCSQAAANCAGGITDTNATALRFRVDANIALCTSGCNGNNHATSDPSQSAGTYIPEMTVPFSGGSAVVNGNRVTSTGVNATASIPTVDLAGSSYYTNLDQNIAVLFFITVGNATANMVDTSTVSGLSTAISFTEALGYIHNISVDSAMSLSFQKEAVKWPGSASDDVARRGWWMSFTDPVDLGALTPVQKINITDTFGTYTTAGSMAKAFYDYFEANPVTIGTNQGLQQIFSGGFDLATGNLPVNAVLPLSLSNLQLSDSTQGVTPNCWGTAKFC